MWFFNKREKPSVDVKLAKECRTCGHLRALGRGKRVEDGRVYGGTSFFYCEGCAPSYDKVFHHSLFGKPIFYKIVPTSDVRVTEEGKPIKTKKTKKEGKKNGGS